jgi:nicotinate-nucleotide adenylyltransferase
MTPVHFTPPLPYQGHLWANRTVGLLGGSFNPAHDGHRHISLYAMKMLGLDAVWWMIAPQNPMKPVHETAPMPARIAEAETVSRHPRIIVTDIEQHLGTRYTADTLRVLKQRFPATRFVWLMGTDNLKQVHRWHDWEDIFNAVPVCVLARPPVHGSMQGNPATERFRSRLLPQDKAPRLPRSPLPAWVMLHIPLNDLSSTAIRAQRQAGLLKKSKKGTIRR